MNYKIDTLLSNCDIELAQSATPTPLYHQIYSLFRTRILDGSIPCGTRMPAELHLAKVFGVSRITAKRAMDELSEEGLVDRKRGRGTHVIHHYESEPVCAPSAATLKELGRKQTGKKTTVLDKGYATPPLDINALLGLEEGEKVYRIIRVRHNEEGHPFAYCVSWTAGISTESTKKQLEQQPLDDILPEQEVGVYKAEQYFGATQASMEVARALELVAGDPVLTLTRHSFIGKNQIGDILFCQYNPKRFYYHMSLNIRASK